VLVGIRHFRTLSVHRQPLLSTLKKTMVMLLVMLVVVCLTCFCLPSQPSPPRSLWDLSQVQPKAMAVLWGDLFHNFFDGIMIGAGQSLSVPEPNETLACIMVT
jgi:zinc transporter ZupT